MPEGVPTWQLDWLTFDPSTLDVNGVQWCIDGQTGFWDGPSPRTDSNIVERIGGHGALVGPMWEKERIITLSGWAFAPDFATLRRAWVALKGVCTDPQTTYQLTCTSEVGSMVAGVQLDGETTIKPHPSYAYGMTFTMQLLAPDPRLYSAQGITITVALPQSSTGDGLDFTQVVTPDTHAGLYFDPAMGGLSFGASNAGGFGQLTNRGTAPSAPVYTFNGPLTTPVLTCTPAGAPSQSFLQYNGTLNLNDSVTIDPSVPSVLLNGTASRSYFLNPADFTDFSVPAASYATGQPGRLTVGLSHSGAANAGGYATATFRDAYF